MQARRAVLAFAIALMLAAVVASLAPPAPPGRRQLAPPPAPAATEPDSPAGTGDDTLELTADAGARRPLERRVRRGARVVLTVKVPEPGDVTVPALGLYAAADSTAPAVFDVLAERAGRFEVVFSAHGAKPRVVAALVVAG